MTPSGRRQLEVLTTLAFPVLIPLAIVTIALLLWPWLDRWLH